MVRQAFVRLPKLSPSFPNYTHPDNTTLDKLRIDTPGLAQTVYHDTFDAPLHLLDEIEMIDRFSSCVAVLHGQID